MSTMQSAPTELAVADAGIPAQPNGGEMPEGEMPEGEKETPRQRSRRRIRRVIRAVLIAWWSIIGFVGLALLGNILVVPLAQSPTHWWDGVQSQIAGLLTLAQTYPTQASIGGFIVLALTFLSFVENRRLRREQQVAAMRPIIVLDERVSKLEQHEVVAALPPNVVAPTGMPLAVSFVGRVDELEDVKRRLREGNNAVGVFAVEGIAGVGKTALAAQATGELAADTKAFPGGAIWVACEGREGASGLARDLVARRQRDSTGRLATGRMPRRGGRRSRRR